MSDDQLGAVPPLLIPITPADNAAPMDRQDPCPSM